MFSSVTTMLLPNSFRKRRSPGICRESDKFSQDRQSFNEYEYFRNIAKELNNVAVDLYNGGDHATAIGLYQSATNAVMAAAECKENVEVCIGVDEEMRAGFIGQIVWGKERLYQLVMKSGSSSDGLRSYQWPSSDGDGSLICLSEGLKIEIVEGEDSDEECRNIATVMYNTGLIHMKNGDVELAEKCFNLAMECLDAKVEEMKGSNGDNSAYSSLVFADLFNNIGCMKYMNGNIIAAEDNFRKALDIGNNALRSTTGDSKNQLMQGYKHVGTIYYNIGVMRARQGLQNEVMEALDCSLGFQKVALGESHRDVAILQHSIGMVLMGVELSIDAMNAFLESLRIVRFLLGNDDYEVAKELFHIGKVHEMRGEYEEALHAYEETLRIERSTLGLDHVETLMTMYEIGRVYQNKGDLDEALSVYHDVLFLAKEASGVEGLSVTFILGEMVAICLEVGNIDGARKLYAEVASTINLDGDGRTLVDIVELAQVKDLLVNIPAAAAA